MVGELRVLGELAANLVVGVTAELYGQFRCQEGVAYGSGAGYRVGEQSRHEVGGGAGCGDRA